MRSELAIHLRPSIFPAGRDAIIECAEDEHAPTCSASSRAAPWRVRDRFRRCGKPSAASARKEAVTCCRKIPTCARTRRHRTRPCPSLRRSPRPRSEFGFRFDRWHRLAALPFGVAPSSAHVEVATSADGERVLTARFGPWCVTTPVENVAGTETSGPYSLVKTAGPAHVSLKDFGLTFATNGSEGLCIRFRRSVPGVAPTGLLRHPALTVTVDDVQGLAAGTELVRPTA